MRCDREESPIAPRLMTRHQLRQWFIVAILFLLVLGISYASEHLMQLHWSHFVGYHTPYSFDVPPAEELDQVSRRLVVVVIDSLRRDFVDSLDSWQDLEQRGATLNMRGTWPSQTVPSWATIVTGTDPEVHGAVTGLHSEPLRVDHIAAAAERAGYPVHFSGNRLWELLIDEYLSEPHYQFVDPLADPGPEPDERAVQAIVSDLEHSEEGLFVVNLTTLRNVSLRQGAERRDERPSPYQRRLHVYDEILAELLGALDLTSDTVLMTASHGTIRRGGHGGSESAVVDIPAVAAGRGVIPGVQVEGSLRDFAPTIAAILGTGVPTHSTGVPLLGLLDISDEHRFAAAEVALLTQTSFYDRKLGALGGGMELPPLSEWSEIEEHSAQLCTTAAELVAQKQAADRGDRVGVLLLTLAAVGLWVGIVYAGGYRAPLMGVLLTAVLGFGLILAMGGRFSLTDFRSTEHLAVWFRGMRSHGILLAASLGMAAGLMTGRRGSYTRPQLFTNALHTLASGMIALMLFAGLYTYWFGYTTTWALPDGALMVVNLSALVFVTAMGQLSILTLALSWLGAVLTVNWWLD